MSTRPARSTGDPTRSASEAVPALAVQRRSTLDGFADAVGQSRGVRVNELEAITILFVRTQNTLYRIVVVDPPSPRILIQGGRFFPEPTAACFSGSSVGGSFLAIAWLGVGLRMEIAFDGRRIVTSPVRSVRIERPEDLPGPF